MHDPSSSLTRSSSSAQSLSALRLTAEQARRARLEPQTPQDQDGVKQAPVVEDKPDPTKRRLTDQEQIQANKDHEARAEGLVQELAGPGRALDHHRRRAAGVQASLKRRGARPVHRELLAAPQSESRTRPRTSTAKSTTRASPMRTSTSRRASPAGGRIAATSILPTASRIRIDSHPSGGNYERPMEEGGGNTSTFPFEIWHYRYLEGIGDNIDIEFVDTCMCGDYHMTIDRSEKDALKIRPGRRPDAVRADGPGQARRTASQAADWSSWAMAPASSRTQSKQFDRLDRFAKLMAPPVIKFKDLESYMVDVEDSDRTAVPVRRAHRLREGHQRHGAGAADAADSQQGHHLQHQGRRLDRHGEHPRPGLDADRTAAADV